MAKTINLSNLNADFISNLSTVLRGIQASAQLRMQAAEDISALNEDKETILANREKLLEGGMSFDEAMGQTSVVEVNGKIREVEDNLKKDLAPYRQARKEAIAGLVIEDLYAAYVVGVVNQNYGATGTVTVQGKKSEKSYTALKSFETLIGEWLEAAGAENVKGATVKKFTSKYVVPFIGTKTIKLDLDVTALSKSNFGDTMFILLKKALVRCGCLVEEGEGADYVLKRKNA